MKQSAFKTITNEFKLAIGLRYNKYGFCGVNPNPFLRHFLESNDLVFSEGRRYYRYNRHRHVWEEIDELTILRKLRRLLHRYEADSWDVQIERTLLPVLPLICQTAEKLRPATNYIDVRNGLINLNTFKLEPHNRDVFSVVQLPIHYDPDAKCPNFRAFLNDVFLGDRSLCRLSREVMGYCISPGVEAQKFFILHSDGSSGKSLFCEILLALAGGEKNVSSVALGDLGKRFQCSQLVDKNLNLSTESDVSGVLDTTVLKSLVSGDPIQIERKGQNPFSYKPQAKIVVACNHLPYPKDKSFAFIRRLIIVPFLARFVDHPQADHEIKIDRDMKSRLLPELPGILNLALGGLKRLRENEFRFTESERANKILAGYRLDVTPLLDFKQVCIATSDDGRISTDMLYAMWGRWREANGHKSSASFTKRHFLRELRTLLRSEGVSFKESKSNGKKYFRQLAISKSGQQFVPRDFRDPVWVSSNDGFFD